jgi:hypothetical protein
MSFRSSDPSHERRATYATVWVILSPDRGDADQRCADQATFVNGSLLRIHNILIIVAVAIKDC